ncbi:MAG TPA: hypothetical protein VH415_05885 [Nitrososphaeraceae archaeon]|jgi:hypothetical protein
MNTIAETAKVLKGHDKITKAILQFMSKANNRISICLDSSGPAAMVNHVLYKRTLLELKDKGVKSMCITEITPENISHCKELIKLTYELRHLDGFTGNFAVSELEYIVATHLQKAKAEPKLIYSNLKEIVEAQQYVFDSLWTHASAVGQKLQNKPFWIWDQQQHRLEDIRTKGDCCFNHMAGLPRKDGTDKPILGYQKLCMTVCLSPT